MSLASLSKNFLSTIKALPRGIFANLRAKNLPRAFLSKPFLSKPRTLLSKAKALPRGIQIIQNAINLARENSLSSKNLHSTNAILPSRASFKQPFSLSRLWRNYKEFFALFALCLCIFAFNVSLEWLKFRDFKEQKHQLLENVRVLQSYEKTSKKGRKYRVLKLESEDFSFYTTTKLENDIRRHQALNLRVINTGVHFKDYLSKSFYMPSYDFNVTSRATTPRNAIISYFLAQHSDEKIIEFYGALFFALPVSLQLRTDVNFYGIAHLIAISGYHIALIFSLAFFVLMPLYTFFQRRYFPYRNARFDLSVIIFVFLLCYAYLLGFVPSYVRSLVMALWGFYLLAKNVKILSFVNLFFSVLLCLALFPQLLFSVGFMFSVMGVFFIFLYMHHFGRRWGVGFWANFGNVLCLNIWTFFAMILPVLYFFPLVSAQQILAILLSAAFVVFYPVALGLHIVGFGGLLDAPLLEFFDFKLYGTNMQIPLWLLLSYTGVALASIFSKWLGLLCVVLNLVPFIMLWFK